MANRSHSRRKHYERGTRAGGKEGRSVNYMREQKEVSDLRRSIGLPQIKKGHRPCLRCNRSFYSEDLASNKICYDCNAYNEGV